MVGTQNSQLVVEVLFVQGDGLVEPARCLVGAGEITARYEGIGMVGAEDVGTVGEVLLVQGDGFIESACGLVGVCQVIE